MERNEESDTLRAVAAIIKGAFVWSVTPEGFGFWHEAHAALNRMADEKEGRSSAGVKENEIPFAYDHVNKRLV